MSHLLKALRALFVRVPRRTPAQAQDALRDGRAVLVDVRERGEWATGVVDGAELLPLTDLVGSRKAWTKFLESVRGREVLLYCKAGGRSAVAAKILRQEGFNAADAGAFREWKAFGWRIRKPDTER